MNYIEIIGPQGVGKSMLLDRLVAARQRGSNWVTYNEALIEIARQISWNDIGTIYGKFLYVLNRINPTPFKRIGISAKLIYEIKPGYSDGIIAKFDYLIQSHINFLSSDDLGLSAVIKARLLNWHLKAVERCFLLEVFDYTKTVVFDEGPYKNHYGLKILELPSIIPGTMPRAVIYCHTSIRENFNRIKMREKATSRLNIVHNDIDDDDLLDMVEKINEVNESNVLFLRNAGIPVLDTDLSGDLTEQDIGRISRLLHDYSLNRNDPTVGTDS